MFLNSCVRMRHKTWIKHGIKLNVALVGDVAQAGTIAQ
jgi:hypothetical protein